MADSMENLYTRMTLEDDGVEEVNVEEALSDPNFSIPNLSVVGRVLSEKQVYNLPMKMFTEKMAKIIGDHVVQFVQANENNSKGGCKLFMRIRVRMDVKFPLKGRMKLRNGAEIYWVDLKYERIPHFCFICGCMRHVDRFCPRWLDGITAEQKKPFGVWLKAGGRGGWKEGSRWLVDEEGQALSGTGKGELNDQHNSKTQ